MKGYCVTKTANEIEGKIAGFQKSSILKFLARNNTKREISAGNGSTGLPPIKQEPPFRNRRVGRCVIIAYAILQVFMLFKNRNVGALKKKHFRLSRGVTSQIRSKAKNCCI